MRPAFPNSRCLPSHETGAIALSSARTERRLPLACGGFRRTCSFRLETWTRPLAAPLSRAAWRPRALVRLLQVDASTSTTADPSNIRTTGSVVGTTARRVKSRLSTGNRRRFTGPGVENTEPRRSPPRLLPAETSPRPRSLRATSCREQRALPCPERRGERTMPPTGCALAWRAPRKGRGAPRFREEARGPPNPRGFPSSGRSRCERGLCRADRRPGRRA